MKRLFLTVIMAIAFSGEAVAATLEVGQDKRFHTLATAVRASGDGDTIRLEPGIYENDFATIRHSLTIEAKGGYAILKASKPIPNGKAILIANADLTLRELYFYNANVPDRNGAGVRYQNGNLTVIDCIFQENENGILGNANSSGEISIQGSIFRGNGHGDGYSHGIYIGEIARLEVSGSHFIDTRIGHHIKSRAAVNIIKDSRIEDGNARSSYSIDLPNGGQNKITENIIIQGARPDNDILISIGTKKTWPNSETLIASNRFANLGSKGIAVRNGADDKVTVGGNIFYGPITLSRGKVTTKKNDFIEDVPQYLARPPQGHKSDNEVIEELTPQ